MSLIRVERAVTTATSLTKKENFDKIVLDNGLQVCYSIGSLTGFEVQVDQKLFIGKANLSVSEVRIKKLLDDLKVGRAPEITLENDIENLTIIDFVKKSVQVVNSIANTQPPLFYVSDKLVLISDSFRTFQEHGVKLELNQAALPEFLVYRVVAPPRTLYANIQRMVAGQSIEIDLERHVVVDDHKWQLEYEHSDNGHHSLDDRLDDIEKILNRGMASQLAEHTDSMVLLSGGNDSSLLASLGINIKPDIGSASTSFAFLNRDDREITYATTVAGHLGIKHDVFTFSSEEYLRGLVESVDKNEEPIDHLQTVLLYLMYSRHQGSRKLLYINGLQADSIFGASLQSAIHSKRKILNALNMAKMRKIIKLTHNVMNINNPRIRFYEKDFSNSACSPEHVLWTIFQYVDPQLVKDLLSVDDEAILGGRIETMRSYENVSLLDKITLCNFVFSIDVQSWQKLAELSGHRYYYPFTIPELVRYMMTIDWSQKLKEGKHLVRQLLRRAGFPNELIERPKASFGFPVQYWAFEGALFQPLVDMAASDYEPGYLKSLQSSGSGRAMLLWNIINLFLFKKLLIEDVDSSELTKEIIDRHRLNRARLHTS